MKKVFPLALLSCLILSFSGLNAADSHSLKAPVKQEAAKPLAYETSGTLTGTPYGDIGWSIFYIGTAPQSITYTNNGTTYGPYAFTAQGGSTYQAGGPRSIGIVYVIVSSGNPVFTTTW
jgi:hypothetical protein